MKPRRGDRGADWSMPLLASGCGTGLAAVLAGSTGLDNRLVAAYRAARAWPYRATFFVLVFAFGVILARTLLPRSRQRLAWAAVIGAAAGYISGFLTWWVVQLAWISPRGALMALESFPLGLRAPLLVPLATSSWAFGAVAILTMQLILRARTRHPLGDPTGPRAPGSGSPT